MKLNTSLPSRFLRDRRGTIALITAIVIFPLLFYCVGVPIDLARQVQLRSTLQNIADDASLAGSAVIGGGGTAAQACTVANAYVKAASSQLSVPFSALTSSNGAPNFATSANLYGSSLACTANAPNTTNLQMLETTSPTQFSISISTNLPTIFLAAVKSSLPVSVSAVTEGPGNFITVCLNPNSTGSSDYNALYYYGYDPNTSPGTLYDVGATGTAPVAFSEGGSSDPSLVSGKPEFLEDDTGAGPTYNVPTTSACPPGYDEVYVHLPLATRIGVEMTSEKGGLGPCVYASTWNANGGGVPGVPYFSTNKYGCMASGTQPPLGTGAKALTNFITDAYGTSVFTTNRYYSTDYPATLNASTTSTVYSNATLIGSAGNFSAANQALVADTLHINPVLFPQFDNQQVGSNDMFFNSRAQFSQSGFMSRYNVAIGTTDLVCMVNNGAPVTPNSETEVSTLGTALNYTNISIGAAQQQNLIEENSLQGNAAQCANTTEGNPYQTDPTCQELNGATLTDFWNDMGSPGYDNVNYGDMPYSFACSAGSGVSTLDYIRPALSQ
jgi:Flp pilus assembly protein TadG